MIAMSPARNEQEVEALVSRMQGAVSSVGPRAWLSWWGLVGLLALALMTSAAFGAGAAPAGAKTLAAHGRSAEGAVSFTVTRGRVTGFRFANVCPADTRAGTLTPAMRLRHGRFTLRDGQFYISGRIRGRSASGTAQNITGDCSSRLLRWRASVRVVRRSSRRATDLRGATVARTGIERVSPGEQQYILSFESYERYVYDHDGQKNGNCTIGYGHLVHRGPCTAADRARYAAGWSQDYALQRFASDLQTAADCVNRYVQVPLNQKQFDALSDFVFNAGCPAFQASTLLRVLNGGSVNRVPHELRRWVHGEHGKVLPGLVRRRGDDANVFAGGSNGSGSSGGDRCGSVLTGVGDTRKPPSGCLRLYVAVVAANYPTDPENKYDLGQGAGQVTLMPAGRTWACDGGNINYAHGGGRLACEAAIYVAAGTTVTLTKKPLSTMGDPPSPPDSEFQKWTGACSGKGACRFRMRANDTLVAAYFGPALVPLSIHMSPNDPLAYIEIPAGEFGNGAPEGSVPAPTTGCGGVLPACPATIFYRVDEGIVLDAGAAPGWTFSSWSGDYSCPLRNNNPRNAHYCPLVMTEGHDLTANFSSG